MPKKPKKSSFDAAGQLAQKRPTFEEFGLNDEIEIAKFHVDEIFREKISEFLKKCFSVLFTIIICVPFIREVDWSLENTLVILVLLSWTGFLIFSIFYNLLYLMPLKTALVLIDGDFSKAKKVRDFEQALAAWENLCLMTGSGYWQALRGRLLEEALAQLFSEKNWKVESTVATGDGGIDLILRDARVELWCQCKGHEKPVSVAPVREITGVCSASQARPMLIVVNGLTKPARAEAERLGVLVWDSAEIAAFARGQLSIDANGRI